MLHTYTGLRNAATHTHKHTLSVTCNSLALRCTAEVSGTSSNNTASPAREEGPSSLHSRHTHTVPCTEEDHRADRETGSSANRPTSARSGVNDGAGEGRHPGILHRDRAYSREGRGKREEGWRGEGKGGGGCKDKEGKHLTVFFYFLECMFTERERGGCLCTCLYKAPVSAV